MLARQRTLEATVDWSYELLAEAERRLLARLSVFSGGWTLEAAEQVCAGRGIDGSDILDLLSRLVDKSLVIVDDGGPDPRYRLLETIRQYARDRLVQSGEIAALGHAHLDYFLALAREAEPRIVGADQVAWLNRLDVEHDNLRDGDRLESRRTAPRRPTDWSWRRACGGSGPSAATSARGASAWSARSRTRPCRRRRRRAPSSASYTSSASRVTGRQAEHSRGPSRRAHRGRPLGRSVRARLSAILEAELVAIRPRWLEPRERPRHRTALLITARMAAAGARDRLIGYNALQAGRLDEASQRFEEVIALLRKHGDVWSTASC